MVPWKQMTSCNWCNPWPLFQLSEWG